MKGKGFERLVLTWRLLTNIVVCSAVVVTHAGNEPPPMRIFWGKAPEVGFYSDLHQTHHKPPQGDPHFCLKNLSLVGSSIWEEIANMHTNMYRQTNREL